MIKDLHEKETNLKEKNIKEEQANKIKASDETNQTHVHEFLASTKLAEEGDDRHNHRFAGVTSEVIPRGNSHVHVLMVNTDFLDHHHEVAIETGPAIRVGDDKHVHFVKGTTTLDDGHVHPLEFATLIQKPLV
ncbi:YmaF family protein [Psychrobacillus sp. OK032]|uniref:YmaF family protein n=1 Tax=Psychrobacillus sp. OK032 TaxID=1884358 RepID=UPI0008CB22D6|nr:YmaF family protein [Psychrobacillus sp. OK032]SES17474.1 YmaF family protein [Psychrobacillus sp. OK032]